MSNTDFDPSRILYEDNHLVIVNKLAGELVQGDKTNDRTLADLVREYIEKRDAKPGKAYLGIPHRLDRPVSGIIVYTKTSKGLSRMSELFRVKQINKIYWAIVEQKPPQLAGHLTGWMIKDNVKNKSFVSDEERPGFKQASLSYKFLASSSHYHLIEVSLETGRHHQIRAQLAHIGCVIKGDLKYGSKRSNPDTSIALHARTVNFVHPIKNVPVAVTAPCPQDTLWSYFENLLT